MRIEAMQISDTLAGDWHHAKRKERLIIVCHGYKSTRNNATLIAITNGLNNLGHDTFTFNFSENIGGLDIEHQVRDIIIICHYFQKYKVIILLAASFSALPGAIACVKYKHIAGLVTINGYFGRGNLGKKHHKDYVKFRIGALLLPRYRKILKYYQREFRPELIESPVLVIYSKIDTVVYPIQSIRFYMCLQGLKKNTELKTANHGVTSVTDRRIIVKSIHKWIA
jgi:hypothetical protein